MARQQQLSCFVDGEMSRQDQHIAMALSLRESTPEPSLVSRFEELIHVTPDGTKICELESFDTDVMPEGVTTLPKYSRLAIPITTESFARLRPEVWLNDEVND
jgi:Ulp1 family protease